jgi:hypothetical protein
VPNWRKTSRISASMRWLPFSIEGQTNFYHTAQSRSDLNRFGRQIV